MICQLPGEPMTAKSRPFGSITKAIGWRTRRIVAQVLGESAVTGIIGAAAGLLGSLTLVLYGPHNLFPPFSLGLVTGIFSGAAMLPYTVIKEANRPEHSGTATGVGPQAEKAVTDYLHPLRGGPQGNGWPFGRSVHPGEILKCLQNVPGARFVTGLQLAAGAGPWGADPIPVGRLSLVAPAGVLIDVQEDA